LERNPFPKRLRLITSISFRHFGREIVSRRLVLEPGSEIVALLWGQSYDDYIEAIDGIDNGHRQYLGAGKKEYTDNTNIVARVKKLNLNWNETFDEDIRMARFEKASALIGGEFPFDFVSKENPIFERATHLSVLSLLLR